MKKPALKLLITVFMAMLPIVPVYADFNLLKAASGLIKVGKAATLSDNDVIAYVKEYIAESDKQNTVCGQNDAYSVRLQTITKGIKDVEGLPLNFKVYKVKDVNAFACADGSIRVYSALMDLMTDDELLGVIGHEIGHVAHKDSKKAFRTALLTSALKDGLSSTGGRVAALTDSQFGALGEALINAKYSRNQERAADDYGYEFLKAHGKNPAAMALSFRKLQSIQDQSNIGGSLGKINQLFSSHPDLTERIKRMEKRATKDGYYLPDGK